VVSGVGLDQVYIWKIDQRCGGRIEIGYRLDRLPKFARFIPFMTMYVSAHVNSIARCYSLLKSCQGQSLFSILLFKKPGVLERDFDMDTLKNAVS